jgi:hypothetical protein
MITELKQIECECVPCRESDRYLVKSVDDIVTLPDDHLIKIQIMRGSLCIKR